jgi:uncharacterized membrane protein YedE/YeeE
LQLDWNAFSPWSALGGGLLIGLGAAALVLLHGRIAGISGIVGGLLRPVAGDFAWRAAFVLGLLAAPGAWLLFHALPRPDIAAGDGALVAAGLLVGLGTRYGAGCTSGHGVCGLSRLSARSAVATATFMAAGFLTVFVLRHLLGA